MTRVDPHQLEVQVAVLDRAGIVVSANQAWLDMARAVPACSALPGASLPLVLEMSADPQSRLIASGVRTMLGGEQVSFTARQFITTASGERQFQLVASRLQGPDSGTGAIVTRTELAPTGSVPGRSTQLQEHMERLFEATRLVIMVFDEEGGCIRASRAALRLFGADTVQQLQHPSRPGMSPLLQADGRASLEKWAEHERQAREQGSLVFEWELVRQDGKPLFTRINLTDLRQGGLWHCAIDDISDLKGVQARVEFLAYHDPLTSLPNQHSAPEQLRGLPLQDGRDGGAAVLSLSIAGFREFNDAYGHSMGDQLLKQVAAQMTSLLPRDAQLYRMAGPEFLLLLPGRRTRAELTLACAPVLELASRRISVEDIGFHLQLKVGATLAPQDGSDPDRLLRQAGMARKQARRDGMHRINFYEPRMGDELLHFLQTGQALRLALERQELELYYQPQVDLASGVVVGAEALMRWKRPGHGLVAPGHFIGAAEDTGLIRPMGRWALREACHQAVSWRRAGWPELRVAVNLSAIQFRHEGIRWDVFDALEESGLPPGCLELELTESLLLEEDGAVSTTLADWKQAGIQLAIDDFGTGYSSLSYLKRLAVDKLKIDRSFISNFLVDDQDRCIVKAMLQMARSLRIRTVAEGIEDESVAVQLASLGCHEGQGFLYARPMPAAEFMRWLSGQELRYRAGSA